MKVIKMKKSDAKITLRQLIDKDIKKLIKSGIIVEDMNENDLMKIFYSKSDIQWTAFFINKTKFMDYIVSRVNEMFNKA